MKIQFSSDKNSKGIKESTAPYIAQIESSLGRFSEIITHLEAHLSDEDIAQNGLNTNRCKLEAQLKNRKPIAVTNHADTYEGAIEGALDKLTASLDDYG